MKNFEKLKMCIFSSLTEELWEEMIALNEPNYAVSAHVDFMTEAITTRLVSTFYSKKEGEFEFEWYVSWWQELRDKILPKWWLRKYPSKWETKKTVRSYSVYPSIKTKDAEHIATLIFID
jgi:hypothetical protein